MFRGAVALLFGLTLPQTLHAAPPKELYGKSVIVSWIEMRDQRPEGEQTWRLVEGNQSLKIYVSEVGRVFNDLSYSTRGGSADRGGQIAGQRSGYPAISGYREITFKGRSLLIMLPHGRGGATRISAEFDSSFGSCSAEVVSARESQGTIIKVYSQIIKRMNEVRSIKVSGSACGVRSGNVFGR
jgi:hypothetical protein